MEARSSALEVHVAVSKGERFTSSTSADTTWRAYRTFVSEASVPKGTLYSAILVSKAETTDRPMRLFLGLAFATLLLQRRKA